MALGFLVLTQYLEGRLQRAREERSARRWSEGRTHGRAEAHREWQDNLLGCQSCLLSDVLPCSLVADGSTDHFPDVRSTHQARTPARRPGTEHDPRVPLHAQSLIEETLRQPGPRPADSPALRVQPCQDVLVHAY